MNLIQNQTSKAVSYHGVRLGIDMGGTLTKFLILDDGVKRHEESVPTPNDCCESIIGMIVEKYESFKKSFNIQRIGIGVPGVVKNGEVFANTFQGKLAECAAVNFFYKYDDTIEIDFDTYDLGIWDKVDLTVCKKEVAVKSTKRFGQLLLLETKDWNHLGKYIPNLGTPNDTYDYIVMVRIEPSCEDLMKKNRLLYKDEIEQSVLKNLVAHQNWSYDYVGYITNGDLRQIIKDKHIIPQGALLNGSTPMDAENYYVQAGDMRKLTDFNDVFKTL